MPAQPFRYPTQNLDDLELIEELPVRSTGMTASMVEAAFGTPHPKSAEHLLVWQEPVVARDGALTMKRVYRRLPGAPLSGEMVRESTWGAPATVTTQDVAAGTHADTGMNVIESMVEPRDAQTARKRTTTVDWPTLTARSVEPTTRTSLTVTRQIVPADTELVSQTSLMVDQEIRAIDKWRSIRIVTSLDTLPAAFQEQKHLRFRFPGLFYGYDSSTGIV